MSVFLNEVSLRKLERRLLVAMRRSTYLAFSGEKSNMRVI
jgi:hypothetical protein